MVKNRKYIKGGSPKEKRGLWDNIHAKRKRIALGSGEKMRNPGSKGAPTEKALKESKAEEGAVVYNKPKRTSNHPTKSHVVIVRKPGGGKKTIRFGEQGASTAGKPKQGESRRMKMKRKSFKARHRKNIAKGKMSAAYWANKVKWEDGGVNAPKGFHWMKKGEGKYKLMEHGDKPFKKHEGASLKGDFPIQKKHNPKQDAKMAKRKYVKGGSVKTMEKDLLDGAGVSTSKRHKNKMKGILYSKEESLYTALGRKAPKRNIFKKGGIAKNYPRKPIKPIPPQYVDSQRGKGLSAERMRALREATDKQFDEKAKRFEYTPQTKQRRFVEELKPQSKDKRRKDMVPQSQKRDDGFNYKRGGSVKKKHMC